MKVLVSLVVFVFVSNSVMGRRGIRQEDGGILMPGFDVKVSKSNVASDVGDAKDFESVVHNLGDKHFYVMINGEKEVPYAKKQIYLGTPEDKAKEYRLWNIQQRNNWLAKSGLYELPNSYKQIVASRNQLANLQRQVASGVNLRIDHLKDNFEMARGMRNIAQSKISSLNTEIQELEAKVERGQLDGEDCFLWSCKTDNKKKLARAKGKLDILTQGLGKLGASIDAVEEIIDKHKPQVSEVKQTAEDLKEQVEDIVKNSTSIIVGQEGKALHEYLKEKIEEIDNLKGAIDDLSTAMLAMQAWKDNKDYVMDVMKVLNDNKEQIKRDLGITDSGDDAPNFCQKVVECQIIPYDPAEDDTGRDYTITPVEPMVPAEEDIAAGDEGGSIIQ